MKEYFKRLRDVLTFFAVWFGIPHLMVVYTQDPNMYFWTIFTWVPAAVITAYLKEDK